MTQTRHEITRVRHETRRRTLTVGKREYVTPRMLRLTLTGAELAGFTSLGADDHVKLFVPGADGGTEMRDYTPRSYDPATNELVIDFALHDAGPATAWARDAKVGDAAHIGGPRGSAVVPLDFDWWLLVGDETALPAIGRRLAELPAGVPVTTLVAVSGAAEEQAFTTVADLDARWVHRGDDADPAALLEALSGFELPTGEGFVWIAAEGSVTRTLRRHILEDKAHPAAWTKASGYWVKGKADATEKF